MTSFRVTFLRNISSIARACANASAYTGRGMIVGSGRQSWKQFLSVDAIIIPYSGKFSREKRSISRRKLSRNASIMGVACLEFRGENFRGWLINHEIRESFLPRPLYGSSLAMSHHIFITAFLLPALCFTNILSDGEYWHATVHASIQCLTLLN